MARRFFSTAEHEALAALPAALQARAFFESWTRKEACLKATGVGLRGLARLDAEVCCWSLHTIDVGQSHVAALAVEGAAAAELQERGRNAAVMCLAAVSLATIPSPSPARAHNQMATWGLSSVGSK